MSKGSSVDTSGIEDATREATAILQQNYEQTRGDVAPWYDIGVQGVNALSDALGLSGGSMKSREQVYNQLAPQYTTTTNTGGQTYTDPTTGITQIIGDKDAFYRNHVATYGGISSSGVLDNLIRNKDYNKLNKYLGIEMGSNESTSVDYDALNAAVDAQYGSQETPDNFGSLLETFDASKLEDDAGYQYRMDEGLKAMERALSAQGVTLGGAGYGDINSSAAKHLEDTAQGLASQEYGAGYDRYVNDQLNTYNMLAGASGMGQAAAGTMANAGQNMASGTANLTTDLASAQLNADIAQASQPSMFSSLLGTAATLGGAALTGGASLPFSAGSAMSAPQWAGFLARN